MLGNYYGESKRARVPIDPVEPEIVEEVACMKQPTKEEVEEIRELIVPFAGSGRLSTRFELIIRLCDAYLALREEVERVNGTLEAAQIVLRSNQRRVLELEADNEALRERLAQVEQASQRIIGNIIGEQQHGTY